MPNLTQSLRNQKKSTQPREVVVSGNLGVKLSGVEIVQVPGRPGFVYVRLMSSDSELIQAYNGVVSPTYDLPVLIIWDVNKYRIKGRDILRYQDWGEAPYLPLHGSTHSFDKTGQSGGDMVWVKSEQFYPFATIPSGTAGAENITILPYTYLWNGAWKYGGNTGTPSLTSLRPTTAGKVKLMLLCIKGSTSNPHFITGSEVDDSLSNFDLVQYYPTVNSAEDIPLAVVRLETGTTSIGWDDLYDVRQYFGGSNSTGTSSSSSPDITYNTVVIGAAGPGADPPGVGAGPYQITENGQDNVWKVTTTDTPPNGAYIKLPAASESNRIHTIYYKDTAPAKYIEVYLSTNVRLIAGKPGCTLRCISDGTTWRVISDPPIAREGQNIVLGGPTPSPTTSKLVFSNGFLYAYEKWDDCFAISSDGTLTGSKDVFRAGWDDGYNNKIAELGDIANEDHGKYIRVDASGLRIVGGLPTGTAGLSAGQLWNDGGVVKIVT